MRNINVIAAGVCGFRAKKSLHQTSKEKFLGRMTNLIPWPVFEELIEPYYPRRGYGRSPYPLTAILRIHCLQQWYNLSDLATEHALYETSSIRRFAQLSLEHPIPNRTPF